MAILALADGLEDMKTRLARMVVGTSRGGQPVTAEDLVCLTVCSFSFGERGNFPRPTSHPSCLEKAYLLLYFLLTLNESLAPFPSSLFNGRVKFTYFWSSGGERRVGCADERCHQTHTDADARGETLCSNAPSGEKRKSECCTEGCRERVRD